MLSYRENRQLDNQRENKQTDRNRDRKLKENIDKVGTGTTQKLDYKNPKSSKNWTFKVLFFSHSIQTGLD